MHVRIQRGKRKGGKQGWAGGLANSDTRAGWQAVAAVCRQLHKRRMSCLLGTAAALHPTSPPPHPPPPPPTSQELLYNVQEQPAAGVHPRHICLELDPETQVGGAWVLHPAAAVLLMVNPCAACTPTRAHSPRRQHLPPTCRASPHPMLPCPQAILSAGMGPRSRATPTPARSLAVVDRLRRRLRSKGLRASFNLQMVRGQGQGAAWRLPWGSAGYSLCCSTSS